MSLLAAIERHAQVRPDSFAIRHPTPFAAWGSVTWRGLLEEAAALTPQLAAHGPIGWLQHNHRGALALLLACAERGQTFAPLNWRLTAAELAAIAADAGMTQVWTTEADALGLPHPVAPWATETRCLGDPGAAVVAADRAPLLLGVTSGTTGQPRGAMLTEAAVMANVAHAIALFGAQRGQRLDAQAA